MLKIVLLIIITALDTLTSKLRSILQITPPGTFSLCPDCPVPRGILGCPSVVIGVFMMGAVVTEGLHCAPEKLHVKVILES